MFPKSLFFCLIVLQKTVFPQPHTLILVFCKPLFLLHDSLQVTYRWLEHIKTLRREGLWYGFVISHLLMDSSEILEVFLTTEYASKCPWNKCHAVHWVELKFNSRIKTWDLPSGSVVETLLSRTGGMWVWSRDEELRSYMPCGQKTKIQKAKAIL